MSVAHTGMPRTKLDVPSIGSTIHRHGDCDVADHAVLLAEQAVVRTAGEDDVRDRRLGLAVGLGHLGAVGLPVEAERALVVARAA